ncbi:LuxR C-terminal-related transcriptional regulator [Paenibacillaceae bacterium WGS1546]|uniref:LuxR C-terminal-related transcriptional regulator n=1 Tax=Cohnella sp. WGS1546 TaxID=3366810 RepID=UPI00372D304C
MSYRQNFHEQEARRDWLDFMIASSRLQYPTVPESYVQRPRLEMKLNGVFKRCLTLITAPPGSGKTMLVSGWKERAPHPVVCITLEEADNHFLRFWLHILAAIHEAAPGFDHRVTEQFVEQFLQQPRGALAFLVAECSRLSEPIAIVLDDYHTIAIPEIHESFSYWIRNMPACLHMIVASRIDIPFRLPKRLRYVIGWSDLAFSRNEARRFYEKALHAPISEEQAQKWQEQTEGWILGMKLMIAHGNPEAWIREPDDPVDIREQLLTQIFTRQSPETMAFLLRTAIPHQLNHALCTELTGLETMPDMLEKLAKDHVFLHRLGTGSEEWFRYHPLVAQLLQDKLHKEDPQLWQALQRKTARWLENNGYPMEAMEHYVRGGHYEEAGMLLEGLFKQFIMSEAWTLMRYFTLIPEQTIQDRPKLYLSYLFFAAGNQDTDRTMQQLDTIEHRVRADAGLRSKQETDYYMRVILVMRAYVCILKKDLDGLVHYLLAYADLGYPDDEIFAYIDYAVQESSRLSSFPGVTGHLSRAKACFGPIVQAWRHVRSYNTAYYAIGYAELMYEWNQLGEAEQYADLARSIGDEQRKAALIVPAALLQARLAYFSKKDQEALLRLQAVRSALDTKELEYWSPILDAYEVKLQLLSAEGDEEAAGRYLASYKAVAGRSINNQLLCALAYARALIARERYAEAQAELTRIQKLAGSHDLLMEQLEAYLLQAVMCRKQGKLRRAAGLFGKAVGLSYKEGHIRVYIDEGEPIREAAYRYRELRKLYRVKERHVSIRYVDQILIAFEAQEARAKNVSVSGANTLSPMEKQVLKALSKSWTSKEIAMHIGVSTGTVNTYIQRIFTKLKVNKRKQAVIEAYRLGWLEIE